MIMGLVRPDQGDILLDGENMTKKPMYERARRGIGYLAQEPSIFLAADGGRKFDGGSANADFTTGETKVDQMGWSFKRAGPGKIAAPDGRYACPVGENAAMRSRAGAGDQSAKFLLLDEPFVGIDPLAVADLQNVVNKLKAKGIGVLITDHNVRETLEIVDRAYIMYEEPSPRRRYAGRDVRAS